MITITVIKVERYGFTRMPECIQKGGDGMAISVDPDQTVPGSALFAQTYLSQYLEFLW